MRNTILISSALAGFIILFSVNGCNSHKNDQQTSGLDSIALIKRGEYLVSTIGCDDCHSPKRMGEHGPELIPELRLSGFPHDGKLPVADTSALSRGWMFMAPDLTAAVGPWGISYAANITSDGTGIGNWSEENFIRAIREGKNKGLPSGRPLLPPMPWQNFRKLTDEDIRSIYYYLKTTRPVENIVPGPKSPAEMNIR